MKVAAYISVIAAIAVWISMTTASMIYCPLQCPNGTNRDERGLCRKVQRLTDLDSSNTAQITDSLLYIMLKHTSGKFLSYENM